MTEPATFLLATLFFTHFLGDFTPLSTPGMQAAKARGKPVVPILAHASVHAGLVAAVVGGFLALDLVQGGFGVVIQAAGLQLGTHFGIDWGRGLLAGSRPGLSDPGSQAFWSALGADQFLHGLVLIWIASVVL